MATTMFDRCGGFASVRKVVSSFYDRILDSALLRKHFETADMRTLIDHQAKFIASLMGGPASYTDDTLRRVHAHLNISRAEFEEMAALLCETLEDFEFDAADVSQVEHEIRKREPMIVSHAH